MLRRLLFMLLFVAVTTAAHAAGSGLRTGDLVFQVSRSSQSQAIQLATKSQWSHVGIVFMREGKPYVLESGNPRFVPLDEWVAAGEDGKFVAKRLRNASLLTTKAEAKLLRVAETLRDKPYDFWFGWSDDKVYCSEFVWKIYKRALGVEIGKVKKLRTFELSHPAVQTKLKERYGRKIPLDEKVVSPGAVYDCDLLVRVEASDV